MRLNYGIKIRLKNKFGGLKKKLYLCVIMRNLSLHSLSYLSPLKGSGDILL